MGKVYISPEGQATKLNAFAERPEDRKDGQSVPKNSSLEAGVGVGYYLFPKDSSCPEAFPLYHFLRLVGGYGRLQTRDDKDNKKFDFVPGKQGLEGPSASLEYDILTRPAPQKQKVILGGLVLDIGASWVSAADSALKAKVGSGQCTDGGAVVGVNNASCDETAGTDTVKQATSGVYAENHASLVDVDSPVVSGGFGPMIAVVANPKAKNPVVLSAAVKWVVEGGKGTVPGSASPIVVRSSGPQIELAAHFPLPPWKKKPTQAPAASLPPKQEDCPDCNVSKQQYETAKSWIAEVSIDDYDPLNPVSGTLKEDFKAELAQMNVSQEIIDSLQVEVMALPGYTGPNNEPAEIAYSAALTAELPGKGRTVIWDVTGQAKDTKEPIKPLSLDALKNWIAENREVQIRKEAIAAVNETFNQTQFKFTGGQPSEAHLKAAQKAADEARRKAAKNGVDDAGQKEAALAAFEKYLSANATKIFKVKGMTDTQAKANYEMFKTKVREATGKLNNDLIKGIRFKLHGTTSTDKSAASNKALSERRADLFGEWFALQGTPAVDAYGTGEEKAYLTDTRGFPENPDDSKCWEADQAALDVNRAVKIEWVDKNGNVLPDGFAIERPGQPGVFMQFNTVNFEDRVEYGLPQTAKPRYQKSSVDYPEWTGETGPCAELEMGAQLFDGAGNASGIVAGTAVETDCVCDMAPEATDPVRPPLKSIHEADKADETAKPQTADDFNSGLTKVQETFCAWQKQVDEYRADLPKVKEMDYGKATMEYDMVEGFVKKLDLQWRTVQTLQEAADRAPNNLFNSAPDKKDGKSKRAKYLNETWKLSFEIEVEHKKIVRLQEELEKRKNELAAGGATIPKVTAPEGTTAAPASPPEATAAPSAAETPATDDPMSLEK